MDSYSPLLGGEISLPMILCDQSRLLGLKLTVLFYEISWLTICLLFF